MLDKRKSSSLSTHRNNFAKQIAAFERDVEDIEALIKHLAYVSNTCASIDKAMNRGKPESVFVLFDDIPSVLCSTMLLEGENAAVQIRPVEKSLEDTTLRMKLIAGDALGLVEQEDCPEEVSSFDLQVGMQLEHVLELQDLVKLYQQEYVRLKRVITRLLSTTAEKSAFSNKSSEPQQNSVSGASELLNHKTTCDITTGWFDAEEVSAALSAWTRGSFLNDRVTIFKMATQSSSS